jgi:hypothetical protein
MRMTQTFRMTLDTTEKMFRMTADGTVVLKAKNHETVVPQAVDGINPTTRQAALRRWQTGLRAVMTKYALANFVDGAYSVVV